MAEAVIIASDKDYYLPSSAPFKAPCLFYFLLLLFFKTTFHRCVTTTITNDFVVVPFLVFIKDEINLILMQTLKLFSEI